jgi:hypothetical protein
MVLGERNWKLLLPVMEKKVVVRIKKRRKSDYFYFD